MKYGTRVVNIKEIKTYNSATLEPITTVLEGTAGTVVNVASEGWKADVIGVAFDTGAKLVIFRTEVDNIIKVI